MSRRGGRRLGLDLDRRPPPADEGDPRPTRSSRAGRRSPPWRPLTSRVRLGLLVGANTFRNPGLTAKLATTIDHLSAGRSVLGLGGGWFEREHDAFGLDFGAGFGERLDRLDEAVGLIRRLLDGERFSHDGRFYEMHDALVTPLPVQQRLPILIGGSGPTKTLRTTARYADIWNGFGPPERIKAVGDTLRERCDEIGRPFDAIERTVTTHIVIRDTPPKRRPPPGTRPPATTGSSAASAPTARAAASPSAAHPPTSTPTSTATASSASARSIFVFRAPVRPRDDREARRAQILSITCLTTV